MLDRNVRGIGIALCLLTLFIFLSGCGSLKDDTLLTVNAVITEVDTGKQTITVKDDADENTLGEECLIDCSSTVKAKLFCPEIAGLFWHRYIIKGKREVPFLVERHLSST